MPPLSDVLTAATTTLGLAGITAPDRDAHALVAHVLDLRDPAELHRILELSDEHVDALRALVARRAAREPLQHLTGRVSFAGLELEVGRGVFVPQPETGPVVDWAVAAIAAMERPAPVVADLCTGAGTIAFSLASRIPEVTVHAVERDPAAFAWTRRNAARRVAAGDPPVQLHLGDVEGCLPGLDGQLDLVAANPPYVASDERHIPDPEVAQHDPAIALWAGDDGLDVIRLVEAAARRLLRPGGVVVVEHSDRQGRTAPAVFAAAGGWSEVTDHVDQLGRDRFVTARWTGAS